MEKIDRDFDDDDYMDFDDVLDRSYFSMMDDSTDADDDESYDQSYYRPLSEL